MRRIQFKLRTVFLVITVASIILGAAFAGWRWMEPLLHREPIQTWTVKNGNATEYHTIWSDGSESMDVYYRNSPQDLFRPDFASEAEYQAAVKESMRAQLEKMAAVDEESK